MSALYNTTVLSIYILLCLVVFHVVLTNRWTPKSAGLQRGSHSGEDEVLDKVNDTFHFKSQSDTALLLHPAFVMTSSTDPSESTTDDSLETAVTIVASIYDSASQQTDMCSMSQCTPLRRLVDVQYRGLNQMFIGPQFTTATHTINATATSNDTTFPYAICEFRTMDAFSFHFPHTMQQLYRCWSWWRLFANDKTPVLLLPRPEMPPANAFLTGFVASLQAAIGLEIIQNTRANLLFAPYGDWGRHVVQPRVPNNLVDPKDIFAMQDPTRPYYAFHQKDDASHLRSLFLEEFATNRDPIVETVEKVVKRIQDDACERPRIAILNRHKHREWLNAPLFIERLGGEDVASGQIPIVYFNANTTFVEQVNFFQTTDILISPHGAQLTGIVFMPDCSSVIEILPSGYYLPNFFGSLALASNLRHGSVSLSQTGDWRAEAINGMQSKASRQKVRNKVLCPEIDPIVDAVQQLLIEWKQCMCSSKKEVR